MTARSRTKADEVKSLWPLRRGRSVYYNGNEQKEPMMKIGGKQEIISKYGLWVETNHMKEEPLVIDNENVSVNV